MARRRLTRDKRKSAKWRDDPTVRRGTSRHFVLVGEIKIQIDQEMEELRSISTHKHPMGKNEVAYRKALSGSLSPPDPGGNKMIWHECHPNKNKSGKYPETPLSAWENLRNVRPLALGRDKPNQYHRISAPPSPR